MSRRQRLPQEPVTAAIGNLSHDGRGICRPEGKTVFVRNALPQETVTFRYTSVRRQFSEAAATDIVAPSALRQTPPCAVFNTCGGCRLQHMTPTAQLQHKQQVIIEQFKHFGHVTLPTFEPALTGPTEHYRRKARFGVKYVPKKDTVMVGFREWDGRFITDMQACAILEPNLSRLITPLRSLLMILDARDSIPQIEAATIGGETALVVRHLKPLSTTDTECLSTFAAAEAIILQLQPEGYDSIHTLYPHNHDGILHERLTAYDIDITCTAMDFMQVNAVLNAKMLQQALTWLQLNANHHVLELFAGLGNFTLPMAQQAGRVTSVEGDATMVARARHNAEHNNLQAHIDHHVADLYAAEPTFPWMQSHDYTHVLLDPPRSGALEIMPWLQACMIPEILYVSCNPATLARDAALLAEAGYTIVRASLMDMFPHTQHVEMMAHFKRSST